MYLQLSKGTKNSNHNKSVTVSNIYNISKFKIKNLKEAQPYYGTILFSFYLF